MITRALSTAIALLLVGCAGGPVSKRPPGGSGVGVKDSGKRYEADRSHGCPNGMARGSDGFCRPANRNRE
jgi:hypothetical protein